MWFNTGAIAGVGAGAAWQQFSNLPISRAWKTASTQPYALDFMFMGDNNSDTNDDHVVSTDASTWQTLQGTRSQEWAFSAYGDGYVYAAQKSGDTSYSIYHTTDLQAWDSQLIVDFAVGNSVEINEIMWDGTQLVIIGKRGDEGIVLAGDHTTDEPWPNVRWPDEQDYEPRGIGYNGAGTYLLVGSSASGATRTPTNIIYRQQGDVTDTWEEVTMPTALNWSQVKYGNGRWLVWAKNSNILAISSNDGDTWTLTTLPVAFSDNLRAKAAFGLDRFHYYAGSRVYSSSDGVSWARSDTTFNFIDITGWAFDDSIGIATGTRSSGNHTSYLKYAEVA